MSNMKIEGELLKRFRIFRADQQGYSIGDVLGEYDGEAEALAHPRRQDWHYVILENRKPVTRAELKARIWTCPICEQTVIARPGSQPTLPPGYFDNCKLKDHMIGVECIARRDLEAAKRPLGHS